RELVVGMTDPSALVLSTGGGYLAVESNSNSSLSFSSPVSDITGGNLTNARPEPVAYVDGSTTQLTISGQPGSPTTIDAGLVGQSVAAGDVDHDGIDEIVVASASAYAVCSAVKGSCAPGPTGDNSPFAISDVAVGDVDGDGNGDVILLGETGARIFNG